MLVLQNLAKSDKLNKN